MVIPFRGCFPWPLARFLHMMWLHVPQSHGIIRCICFVKQIVMNLRANLHFMKCPHVRWARMEGLHVHIVGNYYHMSKRSLLPHSLYRIPNAMFLRHYPTLVAHDNYIHMNVVHKMHGKTLGFKSTQINKYLFICLKGDQFRFSPT